MNTLKKSDFFSIGFRPFFFLAGLIALLVPLLWVSFLNNFLNNISAIDELFWHAHEMFFGFFGALLTGFLLTATANWTGKQHVHGTKLIILFSLFLVDRFSILVFESYWLHLGLIFWIGLLYLITETLFQNAKNRIIFIPLIFFIVLAKFLFIQSLIETNPQYFDLSKLILQIVLRYLIALMAMRLIPFFGQRPFPQLNFRSFQNWDRYILTFIILVPVLNFFWIDYTIVLFLNFILFALLLKKWFSYHPFRLFSSPIYAVLVWGFVWIPIEFFMRSIPFIESAVAKDHALYTGLLGSFAIAMMTRVTLGHTGRNLQASRLTTLAYVLVFVGALTRIISVFLPAQWYEFSLLVAGILWTMPFLIYTVVYSRYIFTPRF